MSQMNQDQQNEYTYGNTSRNVVLEQPRTTTRQVKATPKKHPILKTLGLVLLCGLVGGAAGVGGASYVLQKAESTKEEQPVTAVQQTAPAEVQPTQAIVTNQGKELSIKEIAAKAQSSVVEINIEATQISYGFFGGSYTSQAAGSGVILSEDGYIITNSHVVSGADTIEVKTNDGTTYSAQLIGNDDKSDIAVIKVDASGLNAATIGDSSKIEVGDTAVVIGNPLGTLGGTVTNGIISATNRTITINNEMMTLIQTNAAINNGNSGGGLFNGNGELVGIVNAKDSGMTSTGSTIEGLGFAIPINEAMNVAEQLIENGMVVDRPYIGVVLQTVTQSNNERETGLYISEIVPGSGAEEAGLEVNDRIIQVDDTEVNSYTDLSGYIKNKKVGDVVKIVVIRDGRRQEFDVRLTKVISN